MASKSELPKVLSPKKLAHIVLRTKKFTEMVQFYKTFLGAHGEFENEQAAFLAYDEEHHRIGIINFEGLETPSRPGPGLEHVAFTFDNLDDLTLAYEQRKAHGIVPTWCVNHGGTTSMYYEDPDGNKLESQVDNFDTPAEANEFINSALFRENPVGTDFDPEELVKRVRSGEDHATIKKRIEIGPRQFPKVLGVAF